jgi:hypothetical protein
MHRPIRRSAFAILGLTALLFAGCSAQRLATQAVSFNLTVERAQNEMLLLNVIRAKDRLPMYLSGISGLTGNVQTTLTSSLGSTYTDAKARTSQSVTDTLTRAYTPSVGATFSKNPTFTLAVLDTQEFMRGFLTPLGKDVLNYYWTQGWPPELLLYLLVQRVELQEENGPLTVLRNYPDSADVDVKEMKAFSLWVQTEFLAKDPQIVAMPVPVAIGPELPASEVTNLERLIEVAKEGLSITKLDPDPNAADQEARYQLQKPQTDVRFRFPQQDPDAEESVAKRQYNSSVALENQKVAVTQIGTKTVTFVLRSPEALIYYLGELARLENRAEKPLTPHVCIQGQYQPLFVALPEGTCDNTLVDADTGRERYSIPPTKLTNAADKCAAGSLDLRVPECEGGRSMQALRLLNQIISLQKSAEDNPSTALVRVID